MTIYEACPRLFSIVTHGFFTRHGGVSTDPFFSLNCSLKVDDTKVNVLENRNRALQALGLQRRKLFIPNITHGDHALIVDKNSDEETIAQTDADALITVDSVIVLGITYADCVPVLLSSTDGQLVSCIHAGWRGIAKEVIKKTIEKIHTIFGVDIELTAVIGPAISSSSFVVRDDALNFFARTWPMYVKNLAKDGGQVDLTAIAVSQLSEAKVKHIEKIGGFTDLDPSRYFSHRRDGVCGRHLALVAKHHI